MSSLKYIPSTNPTLTFRNRNGSSLYTGFSPFAGTMRVRNSFRTVSDGSPSMSTSTYVPTFLSDRNCPAITWTPHDAAITPSTGASANGSNSLSERHMNSGFSR